MYKEAPVEASVQENPFKGSSLMCCRVSRLDNEANEYYLTEYETIKIRDTITVQNESGISEGVVIGMKKFSEMTEDDLPNESMWIIQEDEDGTV